MAISFGGIGTNLGGIASTALTIFLWAIGGIGFLILVWLCGKWWMKRKEYNIPVTIWIPRSDNKIIDEISAKGGYFKSKAIGGVTSFRIKRKGLASIDIPPPESRFLVGLSRHLYLVQKGIDDYEPVLPESFMEVETDKIIEWKTPEGKVVRLPMRKAVVNLKCKNQDATAWSFDNEENAKRRFTLHNFWEKYKDIIQITIFILIVLIGNVIVWKGLKEVATALENVAKILQPVLSNSPVVS